MSKNCIIIFQKNELISENLIRQMQPIFEQYNLFCFTDIGYSEPFFSEFELSKYFVLSVADNKNYDNCEMLLVPDNCYVNGEKSNSLFDNRMSNLKNILAAFFAFTREVHLFIGDSGVLFNEFMHLSLTLDDFCMYAHKLNSISAPDIHFIITEPISGQLKNTKQE